MINITQQINVLEVICNQAGRIRVKVNTSNMTVRSSGSSGGGGRSTAGLGAAGVSGKRWGPAGGVGGWSRSSVISSSGQEKSCKNSDHLTRLLYLQCIAPTLQVHTVLNMLSKNHTVTATREPMKS